MSRFAESLPAGANTPELQSSFHGKNVFFYIERSQNSNCVIYEANIGADGKLDAQSPLKVYWVMYAKAPNVNEEGLNMVERNTAYGSTCVPNSEKGDGHFKVTLAALKSKPIDIWVDNGELHATALHGDVEKEILNVYVETTTSWGMPKVKHIDVKYINPESKAVDTERIIP